MVFAVIASLRHMLYITNPQFINFQILPVIRLNRGLMQFSLSSKKRD